MQWASRIYKEQAPSGNWVTLKELQVKTSAAVLVSRERRHGHVLPGVHVDVGRPWSVL